MSQENLYFNTSHVTVYQNGEPIEEEQDVFQYISCYCLSETHNSCANTRKISIHLMLLFIWVCFPIFNCPKIISIHLMLLFILTAYQQGILSTRISIHLMLLFITSPVPSPMVYAKFQYISCYCLSFWGVKIKFADKFQYISCYCLSLLLCCFYFSKIHFNTSHVTVYLDGQVFANIRGRFQYISCYCLSTKKF